MLLDFSCFPTEIPNFLSDEECDHIIQLAKNEGLETSQTVKEGEKHDTMSLGKNTKEYFKVWDQNRDGQIDMDEVKYLQTMNNNYIGLNTHKSGNYQGISL